MILRTVGLIATLALGILLAPLAADAQPPAKVPQIAFLGFPCMRPGWSEPLLPLDAVRQALRELGYLHGQNVTTMVRCANEKEVLASLAADLVTLNVPVIVALSTEAVRAAKQATKTIPIVMLSVADPVETGLVASLARPGGNVTGLSLMTSDLGEKRLVLPGEVAPRSSRVGVLWNPADPAAAREWRQIQVAARALGVTLKSVEVRAPQDVDSAFLTLSKSRVGALITVLDPLTFAQRTKIVNFAAKSRLPSMYGSRAFVEAGGLMAYQPSITDLAHRTAVFVDKILKGAKPADLPVEQPTRFELVINLKTAKALGLTIPQSLLIRADQVLQ